MAFIDNIAVHHQTLKMKLDGTLAEMGLLSNQIAQQEYKEEYSFHDCDCEYCDITSNKQDIIVMSDDELEKAKKKELQMKEETIEIRRTIKALEGYAKQFKKPIPFEDQLK